MVDFRIAGKRQVVSKKLSVTLKIELNNSLLTPEEASERLRISLERDGFSDFIVTLLRETKSSTWELGSLEVLDGGEERGEE